MQTTKRDGFASWGAEGQNGIVGTRLRPGWAPASALFLTNMVVMEILGRVRTDITKYSTINFRKNHEVWSLLLVSLKISQNTIYKRFHYKIKWLVLHLYRMLHLFKNVRDTRCLNFYPTWLLGHQWHQWPFSCSENHIITINLLKWPLFDFFRLSSQSQ